MDQNPSNKKMEKTIKSKNFQMNKQKNYLFSLFIKLRFREKDLKYQIFIDYSGYLKKIFFWKKYSFIIRIFRFFWRQWTKIKSWIKYSHSHHIIWSKIDNYINIDYFELKKHQKEVRWKISWVIKNAIKTINSL